MSDKPDKPDVQPPKEVEIVSIAQVYAKANPEERDRIMQHMMDLFEQIGLLFDQMTVTCGTIASLLEVVGVREDLVETIRKKGMELAKETVLELECGDQVNVVGEQYAGQPFYGQEVIVDKIDEVNDTVTIIHESAFHLLPMAHVRLHRKKGT